MATGNFVSKDEIAKAKQWNVMDYVEKYEFEDWNKVGQSYKNITLSGGLWLYYKNNEWHYKWHSTGAAGRTAINYLTDVKNVSLPDAVHLLNGTHPEYKSTSQPISHSSIKGEDQSEKSFVLPEKAENSKHIFAYLTTRGISRNVIEHCMRNNVLYEGKYVTKSKKTLYNCVFVGYDGNNNPSFASYKGTFIPAPGERSFSGIVTGSNKNDTFRILPKGSSNKTIHLFEAAIDALSWMTIQEMKGVDVSKLNVISAEGINGAAPQLFGISNDEIKQLELISYENINCGKPIVFGLKKDDNFKTFDVFSDKIEPVIPGFLTDLVSKSEYSPSENYSFSIHYDNDFAGITAAIKTSKALQSFGYRVTNQPVVKENIKDWNDYLCDIKHIDWRSKYVKRKVFEKPRTTSFAHSNEAHGRAN